MYRLVPNYWDRHMMEADAESVFEDAPFQTPKMEKLNSVYCSAVAVDQIPLQGASIQGGLLFCDGVRSVDFVLAWDEAYPEAQEFKSFEKRRVFEFSLMEEGLELEYDIEEETSGLHFIKVHAPCEVLSRYAEILKLRMPMKEKLCTTFKGSHRNPLHQSTSFFSSKITKLQGPAVSLFEMVRQPCRKFLEEHIYVDQTAFPDRSRRFTAVYSRDKEYLFDTESPDFFTPSVCSRIVQFILDRTPFAETDTKDIYAFGIERLLNGHVYSAAYPLHDGDLRTPGSMRYTLYHEWASVAKWYRYQPIDYIKEYFGVKIGLYFAWLGFYTHMLMFASVVGVACFIYSLVSLKYNKPSNDICDGHLNVKMCPLCDHFCDYWELSDTCFHAKVTYLFDNPTTVFFAVFMSFWGTIFLELWKRYSGEITHRWDLTGFDTQEEQPRPQYLARLASFSTQQYRINMVTGGLEPKVPFWRVRLPATIFSFSVVLLLVALALAAVLGVVLYRMSLLAALSVYGGQSVITSYAILFTTATAATINLVSIVIFNWMYTWVAKYLTELELLRTQTEFDDSLTLKMYLLQFVNYYASIFYIAFFKGKLVGYPGNYNRIFFGYRQEECGPGGCLMELCIQLAIIMIGKQAVNTGLEMLYPFVYKRWNALRLPRGSRRNRNLTQLAKDYKLVDWGSCGLFAEYLEMVLQYGFVTIFVAAFPLAPIFALLNNVLEMRLDAKKLLTFHRRPVSQRVRDIGIWFRILDSVGKLGVITNGLIIAFTSDFIPRLVYRISVSPDYTLDGFLNHSMAYMETKKLQFYAPNTTLEYCRYPDYREPPWSPAQYNRTTFYWNILAARLAFVVLFENIVVLVVLLVQWCVPDMPAVLRDKIRREAYITNEIIIAQEAARAKEVKQRVKRLTLTDSEQSTPVVDGEKPLFVPLTSQEHSRFGEIFEVTL